MLFRRQVIADRWSKSQRRADDDRVRAESDTLSLCGITRHAKWVGRERTSVLRGCARPKCEVGGVEVRRTESMLLTAECTER